MNEIALSNNLETPKQKELIALEKGFKEIG